jgi:transcriptional regulator with XRE-family HTH domain
MNDQGKSFNPFLKHLAQYLIEIGRDCGWLSEVTGVNRNTINAMYSFNRWPRLDVALQISEGLGLPLTYLVNGQEEDINLSREMKTIVDLLSGLNEDDLRQAQAALQMWFIMYKRFSS